MAATSADDELSAFPNLLKTTCPVNFVMRGVDVINRVHRRVAETRGSAASIRSVPIAMVWISNALRTHAIRGLVIESREEPKLSQKARG